MMISLDLVQVGWAIVIGHTKRQFQIANLLEIDFKWDFLKINILQVVMLQNVLMDSKILKEKQICFFFFNVFWNLCVLSNKNLNSCVFLISYTCIHVILYKCESYILIQQVCQSVCRGPEAQITFNKTVPSNSRAQKLFRTLSSYFLLLLLCPFPRSNCRRRQRRCFWDLEGG